MNSNGFELSAPANKKLTFIKPPKKAAIPVNSPKMRPSPTNSSPYATMKLNSFAFGNTVFSKKDAYHPDTSPPSSAFANTPLMKP